MGGTNGWTKRAVIGVILAMVPVVAASGSGSVAASELSEFAPLVDINQVNEGSRPDNFLVTDSGLYFTADDGVHGQELWFTDGTDVEMVADINPAGSSGPDWLVELNGEVFFAARTDEHGDELWKTDGTEAGTVMVKDIWVGDRSSFPEELAVFDGEVWFAADDGTNGTELWRSDGTPSGTTMFADLNPGSADLDPDELTAVSNSLGDYLVFSGEDTDQGREVQWIFAGSAVAGVSNLNGTADSRPQQFRPVGDDVYYTALDGSAFKVFRLTDPGGGLTTELVGGHNVGGLIATPAANPNKLIFSSATAGDPSNAELYVVQAGTTTVQLVDEINSTGSASIAQLVPFKTGAMFRATDGSDAGVELWVSDGVPGGTTQMVEDLDPVVGNSSVPNRLTAMGPQRVLFQARTDVGLEMWVSDGTANGTYLVADIDPAGDSNPSLFHLFGGEVYVVADHPAAGRELLRGDPTGWSEGATDNLDLFADVRTGTADSEPSLFTALGDRIFAVADDGIHGGEPMVLDPIAGTADLIVDLVPGASGSDAYEAVSLGDEVAFAAYDDDHGGELWFTDGTEVGTAVVDIVPGSDSSEPGDLFAWNGSVLFNAVGPTGGSEPWISDGTVGGTTMLADTNPTGDSYADEWTLIGDEIAFLAEDADGDQQVWITDGSPAGTGSLFTTPGADTAVRGGLITVSGALVFSIADQLWRSDGTEAGTEQFGPADLDDIDALASVGELAYFVARDDSGDNFIWVTDGTSPGSSQVYAFDGELSSVDDFAPLTGATAVFAAFSDDEGAEPYLVDPSTSVVPLPPTQPGPVGELQGAFLSTQDRVFFTATDDARGREWWSTDGETTSPIGDAFPGPTDGADSFREENRREGVAAVVGRWFIARIDAPDLGTEPWFLEITPSVPDAPTGVAAQLDGPDQDVALVTWEPSPDEPLAPVTSYTATASPGGATCSTPANTTSCGIAGLELGTTYTFTVVATNERGDSPPSAPSSEVTTPAPVISDELDAAARFVPLPPQRLFDTRPTEPGPGPKAQLQAGDTIDVQVTGVAGVPDDAIAVVMNVTAAETLAPGFITVFPKGTARPNASSINLTVPGQVRPNLVTVLIGDEGKVSLYSHGGAHLLADVAGYYIDADAPTAGGRFVPLTPQRVFDTRPGEPAPGPKGHVQSTETIEVQITGVGDVPVSGVAAIVMNLTATDTLASGFVTAFPTGDDLPVASNLNFAGPGETTPNLAIVPLGDGGQLSFYTLGGTHLLGDVTGYITDDTAAAETRGLFVPLEPTRVFDTREEEIPPGPKSFVPAGGTIEVQVGGAAGVPNDAASVVLNVTGVDSLPGFLTAWESGPVRPTASTLNFAPPVDVRANAAMLPVGAGGRISFFTQSGGDMLADTAGYHLG